MPNLDEILKQCCKICGCYRCDNHLDWLQCGTEGCMTKWDSIIFLGCPTCLEKEGKPVYRPALKEVCCLCNQAIRDGALAYTDATPKGTFCEVCAAWHKIDFWTITVRTGRLWTPEEIVAERAKVG